MFKLGAEKRGELTSRALFSRAEETRQKQNASQKIDQNNLKMSATGNGAFPLRIGLAMPVAAGATLLLLFSMARLIATEFTPQDKLPTASFDINPVPDDILPPDDISKPDPLKKVDVPSPPPSLDVVKVAEVALPVIEVGGKELEWDPTLIDIGINTGEIIVADADEQPTVRIPPVFPPRFSQGNHSGYCNVRFDVSAQGAPFNVEAISCTNRQLTSATVKSVQKWKYKAAIENGQGVSRRGLKSTIRFDLRDERGDVLPLPNGY